MLKQDYHFESRALYPELKGKRVVVTGGASGIGKATAKRFVLEGAKVVVFDYNEKAFDALKQEIPGLAGAVKVDVSSEESVKAAFAEMDKILGRHRHPDLQRGHFDPQEVHRDRLCPVEARDGRQP